MPPPRAPRPRLDPLAGSAAADDLYAEESVRDAIGHHPERDRLGLGEVTTSGAALGDRDRVEAGRLRLLLDRPVRAISSYGDPRGEPGDRRIEDAVEPQRPAGEVAAQARPALLAWVPRGR